MRRLVVVLIVALLLGATPLHADENPLPPAPAREPAAALALAQARLMAGDYAAAAALAGPVAMDAQVGKGERAEAFRLLGLARMALGDNHGAEIAFLEFLRREPDAHLDPVLVPPETIAFFEGVRARHAGELQRLQPRLKSAGSMWLAFLPPLGQFQNGDRVKGWALTIGGGLLLATSITTFAMLHSQCDQQTLACDDPGVARTLRTVNLVSGVLFAGVWVYGTIDGVYRLRERRRESMEELATPPGPPTGFGVQVGPGAAVVTFGATF